MSIPVSNGKSEFLISLEELIADGNFVIGKTEQEQFKFIHDCTAPKLNQWSPSAKIASFHLFDVSKEKTKARREFHVLADLHPCTCSLKNRVMHTLKAV